MMTEEMIEQFEPLTMELEYTDEVFETRAEGAGGASTEHVHEITTPAETRSKKEQILELYESGFS